MSADLQALAVAGQLLYTFDWAAEVPAAVTIISVAYVLPSPLTQFASSEDFGNKKSTIGLQGALHGETYQVRATATLSNTEQVVKNLSVRGFNG
jgi:hypothetical protein